MKNYREIYDELTKQIAELKTKRTDISSQLEEATLKYNDIKTKNNRKLSTINYKIDRYYEKLDTFNAISGSVTLLLCVAIILSSSLLNISVPLEIVIAILSSLTCGSLYLIVLKSHFHKMKNRLFNERYELMDEYQPEIIATKIKWIHYRKKKKI